MAKAQFDEPKDLEVPLADRIGDGTSFNFQKYDVSHPHPGYGKDPNILNEYGHSVYPKMVYPHGQSQPGVIVNSEQEEKELLNPPSVPEVQPPQANTNGGWGTPK